jgi:hypothetical protein
LGIYRVFFSQRKGQIVKKCHRIGFIFTVVETLLYQKEMTDEKGIFTVRIALHELNCFCRIVGFGIPNSIQIIPHSKYVDFFEARYNDWENMAGSVFH